MLNVIKISIHTLKLYNGSYVLFLLAYLYMIIVNYHEKKKFNGIIFYVGLVLLIFFNPITAKVITICIGEGVYWRYLWILPMGIYISYAGTHLILHLEKNSEKTIICLLVLASIMLSGENMYNSDNFEEAENVYKIPQEVVEVCQILNENEIQDKVALPEGLRYYVRQYDAGINVLYTRMINHTNEGQLLRELEAESPNAETIDSILNETLCRCVVINKDEDLLTSLALYGYEEVGHTENYSILYK